MYTFPNEYQTEAIFVSENRVHKQKDALRRGGGHQEAFHSNRNDAN